MLLVMNEEGGGIFLRSPTDQLLALSSAPLVDMLLREMLAVMGLKQV
jgi:hypothetical protein